MMHLLPSWNILSKKGMMTYIGMPMYDISFLINTRNC